MTNDSMLYKDLNDISWTGTVPPEWTKCKFKNLVTIENGRDYKDVYDENGPFPVIGSGGNFSRASEFLYKGPSVLLGRKGTIDKPLFVNQPFWTVDTMYYTRIKEGINPKYVYYYATCFPFSYYEYGSALPSMTQSDLYSIPLSIPDYASQCRIASFLDEKCKLIDSNISLMEECISQLKKLKQSLIYEYVTGKKMVDLEASR